MENQPIRCNQDSLLIISNEFQTMQRENFDFIGDADEVQGLNGEGIFNDEIGGNIRIGNG